MARFYDSIMRKAETESLGPWRRKLLADLSGTVLEIGAGTGVNLDYYPDTLVRLILSEPDKNMRIQLTDRLAKNPIDHEVIDTAAESLPFPDQTFDAAVVTLVLCSVTHPEKSLSELYRVLKPGGKLVVIEHIAAPGQNTLFKWQKRFEPLWKRCAGNCHLTRDTLSAIRSSGFNCDNLQHDSMRGALAVAAPTIHGIAEKV